MSATKDELVKRTFDHMQRIHGLAPSDLPAGLDIGDEHSADHETGRFEHSVSDLFLYIEELEPGDVYECPECGKRHIEYLSSTEARVLAYDADTGLPIRHS